MEMHAHFDNIERDLAAGIEAGGDSPELLDRLARLLSDVRGARFAASHARFGKQFDRASGPEETLEGIDPPLRQFARDATVRTKEGYLARVGYYDKTGSVVCNVVFEACAFSEADLREVKL